ncbi:MAG TPA: aminotransferase class V-fold PLP-dependent enzyme [Vicinamibacterales bacterium]|nr:aminotransferase class V-fold PLP-dependent enzyme [Vicinamibacterales bacterium]
MSWRADFDLRDDVVWLNSAHQSALPRRAAEAAAEAVRWKLQPWELTTARFQSVPAALRRALGAIAGVPADEVILTSGASFGLHALANSLPLERGDEVLVLRGDFPSNILPWRLAERAGVVVRPLEPARPVLSPDEVRDAIGPATRVVCLSWVHSFSGHAHDLDAIGAICRERGVWFVVNATQGMGLRPFDADAQPIDAVVCSGWKGLCGPYGTGFAWFRPALLDRMIGRQAYWLTMQTADDLARTADPELPARFGPRQYEIFGTANFFNFVPFEVSASYVGGIGAACVCDALGGLVDRFIAGLDRGRYDLVSPAEGPSRSTLVVFSHRDPARNEPLHRRLLDAGIWTAARQGRLRISPHVYNTADEIDRTLAVLGAAE